MDAFVQRTFRWAKHELCEGCWLLTAPLPADMCLSSAEFAELWRAQPEEKGKIVLRGQLQETPRKQQPYELPYYFSGMVHRPDERYPTPAYAKRLQAWLRTLAEEPPLAEYGFVPNELLINWYADGHDYIGPHSDDESQLQLTPRGETLIITTSHGAQRKFRFRRKSDNSILRDFELANNTLCVMGGLTQRQLKHEIVKVNGERGRRTGPRISVTVRHFREASK